MLSAVIPTLEEAATLPSLLAALAEDVDEIVVADGGSRDATVAIATTFGATVVRAPRGRGTQLAAGAEAARGERLWFLHADTVVSADAIAAVRAAPGPWGCFAVRIGSDDPRLRWTAFVMNTRARRAGSCTGDMGIWMDRAFYAALGGWPALPALEDLALTDVARARARPAVLTPPLVTSARRWERGGVNRTVAKMLALRWAYRCGVAPERLAGVYAGDPR